MICKVYNYNEENIRGKWVPLNGAEWTCIVFYELKKKLEKRYMSNEMNEMKNKKNGVLFNFENS